MVFRCITANDSADLITKIMIYRKIIHVGDSIIHDGLATTDSASTPTTPTSPTGHEVS